MGDRPNARPLATNEDNNEFDMLMEHDDEGSGVADMSAIEAINMNAVTATPRNATAAVSSLSGSGSGGATVATGTSKRRIAASTAKTKKSKSDVDDALAEYFGLNDDNRESLKQLRVREVEAKEREASAKMLEAEAASKKAESESTILGIQASATLLHERKRLLDEGISQEDMDTLLPIKKN